MAISNVMSWFGHVQLPVAITAVFAYLGLVRLLRYRRRNALLREYGYTTRESLARMTATQAYSIQLSLASLEFPTVFSTSIFFALFKTYGIPSISNLLLQTGELASPATTSKRAADTGLLLTEIVLHPPNSPRAIDGIARMNFLHSRYRRSRKISDEDMLYTLSLFSLEASRWTERYEWRTLNDLERCAIGTYWKDLGDSMEIPYTLLKSNGSWRDGLQWLEELEEWSLKYEAQYMLPAKTNERLAHGSMDMAMHKVPHSMRGVALHFFSVLLGERLRTAMMFEQPPQLYFTIANTLFTIRKLAIRHFFLPRPESMRKRWNEDHPDPVTGKLHAIKYRLHPWYVKPTLKKRWGPSALLARLGGGVLPGDEGDKYIPSGYYIPDLGPAALVGKGGDDMDATRSRLRVPGRGGCPFSSFAGDVTRSKP